MITSSGPVTVTESQLRLYGPITSSCVSGLPNHRKIEPTRGQGKMQSIRKIEPTRGQGKMQSIEV
ncbi:unnamed protein product [Nezara viridula]|uniref:Uncharacterized protein n=1 Tax=Nezara viridula TaxID=85310 RepID=A0A9P0E4U7_NEZVI|nr:unnamed protein product [Nezara viridula]